jgi:hypothetical protein
MAEPFTIADEPFTIACDRCGRALERFEVIDGRPDFLRVIDSPGVVRVPGRRRGDDAAYRHPLEEPEEHGVGAQISVRGPRPNPRVEKLWQRPDGTLVPLSGIRDPQEVNEFPTLFRIRCGRCGRRERIIPLGQLRELARRHGKDGVLRA